jgi:hypothetical protein
MQITYDAFVLSPKHLKAKTNTCCDRQEIQKCRIVFYLHSNIHDAIGLLSVLYSILSNYFAFFISSFDVLPNHHEHLQFFDIIKITHCIDKQTQSSSDVLRTMNSNVFKQRDTNER